MSWVRFSDVASIQNKGNPYVRHSSTRKPTPTRRQPRSSRAGPPSRPGAEGYDLKALGRDGVAGGAGEDADINLADTTVRTR